ncbi:MAG TPA: hypothetical protein VMB71_02965, partial [Acetobacteraceae bacterium]|nr:hypothetical protein [Acetobacteraceae bacterium]
MKPLSAADRPAAAILIASALALGACTAADQTAAPAQSAAAAAEAASRVRVFQAGQKLPFAFVPVGTAKGYACNSIIPDFELARRRAIAQAQSAAVSLHANAI